MVEELCEAWEPPLQLHVGNEAWDEHEVKRPITNHLVGNVDIPAQGVTRFRTHGTFSLDSEHRCWAGQVAAARPSRDGQAAWVERPGSC